MKHYFFFLFTTLTCLLAAQPAAFFSRGIGGGGGLFSPSINPADGQEFYLASDLGGLYHTVDGAQSYEVVHFTQAIAGVFGKVCFTQNESLRYALLWDADNYARRPAKSTDDGQTWHFLPGDSEIYEDKLFLFADYHQPNRLIWTDYNHIYFSDDGGSTSSLVWTAQDFGVGVLLSGVFFDGAEIWLGTNEGVLYSSDGGQTFSPAAFTGIPADEAIMGFGAAKEGDNMRFYALTGDVSSIWATNMGHEYWQTVRGVYVMDNASGSWQQKMTGIDVSQDFLTYLAMAENDINTCYLAGTTPYEEAIVFKTEDGGDTWQQVFLRDNNQNIYTGYEGDGGDWGYSWGGYPLGFTVNAQNSDQALMTDFGFVHRTTDGGASWHQAYLHPEDENPPGQLTPTGKSYRGVGLEQTSVWQLYWFDEQTLFGCFTDIRGIRSEDGGTYWNFDYSGHTLNTMYRIVKHREENLWFGANSSVHDIYQTTYITDQRLQPSFKDGQVLYTTDKGKTWQLMRDFDHPVIWLSTDPQDAERLYAGVVATDPAIGGLWRADGISSPATATWTKLPNPPANNGRIFNIHVLNDGMLVTTWSARKENNASVFSDSSGVFVSADGGQSWERRNHPDMNYWTKDLVVDPFDPQQNTWYACVWSGWGGPANDLGGLFRTTDRGLSWEKITEDHQFHRVSSVTTDPKDAETMYLTTEEEGLWVTHNKSASMPDWELVTAYPFHHPERVFFNPYDKHDLWVCSFGNGMQHGSDEAVGTSDFPASSAVSLEIYGNPATEFLDVHIHAPGHTSVRLVLYDLLGREVMAPRSYALQAGEGHIRLSLHDIPPGTYILACLSSGGFNRSQSSGGFNRSQVKAVLTAPK